MRSKNSRRLFFRLSGRSLGGNAGIVLLCNKKMAVGRFYGHRRESGGPGVRTQGAAREQADAAERERQQMKSQVSCVPSNHMRLPCLRLSRMLCVTVELVGTSLIALTFRLLFALS